ncbi:MAG TPA: hypothetical protein VIV66_16320, partial [Pyrinomonadaceae bacterium]
RRFSSQRCELDSIRLLNIKGSPLPVPCGSQELLGTLETAWTIFVPRAVLGRWDDGAMGRGGEGAMREPANEYRRKKDPAGPPWKKVPLTVLPHHRITPSPHHRVAPSPPFLASSLFVL